MSDAEVASFLAEERTVTCATGGPRGWPHLMPLWYVLREPSSDAPHGSAASIQVIAPPGPRIWAWTYGSSQKVRNIERDPRATLQVEAGERYQDLRGVMLECDVIVHRDTEKIAALGKEIFARYASPRGEPAVTELAVDTMVAAQAQKRVALEFVELRRATWDHRKLGGAY
ncbi:MAG TPA: pyridoxamine 5'-phosphate oxidase family protein [Solirubrobacteraceae bacterium]